MDTELFNRSFVWASLICSSTKGQHTALQLNGFLNEFLRQLGGLQVQDGIVTHGVSMVSMAVKGKFVAKEMTF